MTANGRQKQHVKGEGGRTLASAPEAPGISSAILRKLMPLPRESTWTWTWIYQFKCQERVFRLQHNTPHEVHLARVNAQDLQTRIFVGSRELNLGRMVVGVKRVIFQAAALARPAVFWHCDSAPLQTLRSMRPGRSRAGSRMSMRLVAIITLMFCVASKPSS